MLSTNTAFRFKSRFNSRPGSSRRPTSTSSWYSCVLSIRARFRFRHLSAGQALVDALSEVDGKRSDQRAMAALDAAMIAADAAELELANAIRIDLTPSSWVVSTSGPRGSAICHSAPRDAEPAGRPECRPRRSPRPMHPGASLRSRNRGGEPFEPAFQPLYDPQAARGDRGGRLRGDREAQIAALTGTYGGGLEITAPTQ